MCQLKICVVCDSKSCDLENKRPVFGVCGQNIYVLVWLTASAQPMAPRPFSLLPSVLIYLVFPLCGTTSISLSISHRSARSLSYS